MTAMWTPDLLDERRRRRLRRRWRQDVVSKKADAHELARMALVPQAAHGVGDGLMSVGLNEVLHVGDGDSHDGVGEVLRRDPSLVVPAEVTVREFLDDFAGEFLDGHLEFLRCYVEEVLVDALPDLWQIGDVADDEHHDAARSKGCGG